MTATFYQLKPTSVERLVEVLNSCGFVVTKVSRLDHSPLEQYVIEVQTNVAGTQRLYKLCFDPGVDYLLVWQGLSSEDNFLYSILEHELHSQSLLAMESAG